MPVKIRLARRGRSKAPFYHIVVADARAPRDGKFIEQIGAYNPLTSPATIELDRDKAFDWIMKGAQPTETARAILRFKGILYRKHLARGVAKGALSQEKADQMYQDWIGEKDAKIAKRFEETKAEKQAFYKAVSGVPGAVKADHSAAETELAEFQETAVDDDAPAEEAAENVAEAATTEAPAETTEVTAEAVKEAPAETAEAATEATAEVVEDAKAKVEDAAKATAAAAAAVVTAKASAEEE